MMGLRRFQFVNDIRHHLAIVKAGEWMAPAVEIKYPFSLGKRPACVALTKGAPNISQHDLFLLFKYSPDPIFLYTPPEFIL